jgi:hypothetical protein
MFSYPSTEKEEYLFRRVHFYGIEQGGWEVRAYDCRTECALLIKNVSGQRGGAFIFTTTDEFLAGGKTHSIIDQRALSLLPVLNLSRLRANTASFSTPT